MPLEPFWIPSLSPPGPNLLFWIVIPLGCEVFCGRNTRPSPQPLHLSQEGCTLWSKRMLAFCRSPVLNTVWPLIVELRTVMPCVEPDISIPWNVSPSNTRFAADRSRSSIDGFAPGAALIVTAPGLFSPENVP